jgi:hypothetical protein
VEAFIIKRGDTLPALEAVLSDDSGPVNLAGSSVYFVMREAPAAEECDQARGGAASVAVMKRAAVVVGDQGIGSTTRGRVRYEWSAGDTARPGRYLGEFEVHFGSSGIWSFPSVGSIPVLVNEDIG